MSGRSGYLALSTLRACAGVEATSMRELESK